MTAVRVQDLRHTYAGGREALKGVSFEASPGERLALLGPNGGGKSTIFRILSTYFAPTSGRAEIMGVDLLKDPAAVRRKIGVVFQNPSLDAKLTVRENLVHQGRLYGSTEKVDSLLDRFGLTERRDELTGKLSGGLRRRVELAKGLLHSPEVLLLDEPSTGLDPAARREMWAYLDEIKTTIIVTTHLMDEADRCERIVLLNEGKVAAQGTPAELKAAIGGDVITIETAQAESLKAKIAERFGQAPAVLGTTLRLERPQGHSFIPQLVEAFPGLIESIHLSKPTLEDVFIRHTGRRL